MRAHKLLSKAVVSLCALAATFAISCVPAGAEISHKLLSSITEVPAQGPKGEAIALPGPLSEPEAMTIDGGDLYVAELVSYAEKSVVASPARIDVFDTATHAFLRQFDQPALPAEDTSVGIAVGHATGSPQIYAGAFERIKGEPYSVVVPYDAEGHQLGHPWLGEDTPAGAFSGHLVGGELEGQITDVAVDSNSTSLLGDWAAGDVFVATSARGSGSPALNVVDILKPETGGEEKYQAQLTGTCESPGACPGKVVPFSHPSKIAVDPRNGDLLVVDRSEGGAHSVVDIFRPGPIVGEYEFVGSLTGSPKGLFNNTISSVAVDSGEGSFAEGAIYISEFGDVYQFNSTGQYVGQFSGSRGRTASVAVDPATHNVYLGAAGGEGQVEIYGPSLVLPDVTTAPGSGLAPESATLNGSVNPDKAGAGETTCQFVWGTSESFGHVLPCPAPVAEGESPTPVSALLEGLEPDTTYYFRLQASNANGTNVGEASQTLHFTSPGPGVGEESAYAISSTSATLGASIDPHGAGTTYYFQYGITSTYGSEAPASPGVSIGAGEGHNEETQHLQGLSPNTTYHYRAVVVSDLEVEPGVFKEISFEGHDQTFTTQTIGGSLILPDGRAWELVSPPDKHGSVIVPHATRASESGDAVTYSDFGPPIGEDAAAYGEGGSQVFSQHGSDGWSTQDIGLPHRLATGLAIGHQGYVDFSEDLSLGLAEEIGTFTSLAPEATPADTERTPYIRHDDTCSAQPSSCYLPLLTGAPGYADVPPGTVFDDSPGNVINEGLSFVAATPDLSHVLIDSKVALTRESGRGFYEWSSEKPPTERLQLVTEDGSVAGLHQGRTGGGLIAENGGRLGLSEDGSRVIVASGGHLYQRDMTDGRTAQLDEVQSGASGAGGPNADFQVEGADGSVIYFTDSQSLTKDSVEGDDDLYECRMHETAGEYKCDLTDVAHTVSGASVLGASKDAAYVYFVSSDVLVTQDGSDGEKAVAGAPDNLYELHDGAISLIAVPNQGLPARVSPDGNYLAFGSQMSLTGYDNAGAEELFLFDSATDRVACASCNPSGTRPEGSSSFPHEERNESFPGPGKTRYLAAGGQLFFESSEALVPQDINKNVDVYEYEPVGVGSCSPSSLSYKASSDGCIGLISSGTATGESTFLDASENGDDAFFLTTEKLAADDVDTAADIYDARVCSNAMPCAVVPSSSPPCVTADACRAAPSPQPAAFGSPASATFVGSGNVTSKPAAPAAKPKSLTQGQKLARALKICRREAKHKRATCERKARKQYSSKPAHRARVTKGGKG